MFQKLDNLSSLSFSNSSNGYFQFGEFIIQWGYQGSNRVTFPISYKKSVIVMTEYDGAMNKDLTGFINSNTGYLVGYWLSVGC